MNDTPAIPMPVISPDESAAYRRGFLQCQKLVKNIAVDRSVACQRARDDYKKTDPTKDYLWMSENCAAREADYISRLIMDLTP